MATTFLIRQPNLPDGKGRTPLRLLRPIDTSANLAENIAEADGAVLGAVEALVSGGARLDLKDGQGLAFAEWQPNEGLQTAARNAAAAYKVRTPDLLPTYSRLTPDLLRTYSTYSRLTPDLLPTYSRLTPDLLPTYSRLTPYLLSTYSRLTPDLLTGAAARPSPRALLPPAVQETLQAARRHVSPPPAISRDLPRSRA